MSNTSTELRRERRVDRLVALALFVAVVVVVAVTAQSLGFVRDEGYYFKAGVQYAEWWRALFSQPTTALSSTTIDQHLSYNPEHPFLMKGAFALSWLVNDGLGRPWLQHNALRFPGWIAAGLSTSLVFLLGRQLLSRRAALLAAACFIAMPHVFWHMHLAAFDVGVAAAHTALVWAWLRFRHTTSGAVVVGVVFGVAGAVKHNVLPIPALLVLHWLLCEARRGDGRLRIPLVFLCLAFIGPAVYVLLWPYLWPDVAMRFGQYIAFHLHHEHYPILYFGDLLVEPPFPILFPFVMSAVTIPAPILTLMAVGVVVGLSASVAFLRQRLRASRPDKAMDDAIEVTRVPLGRSPRDASGKSALLLLLNAFVPFALIAAPSTPIFGGTKHWMNALPFLCVLAAWALDESFARLRGVSSAAPGSPPGRRSPVAAVLFWLVAAAIVLPGVLLSARVWPYGLGSYNEVIGFSRGAANVGMQRTFWGYETREALPAINARTPRNGRIHFGDVNADSHRMYGADGLLRKDIGFSNTVRAAAVAHVEPQGEFKQQQIDVWNEWQTRVPDLVIGAEGVPLSTVTFRPRTAGTGALPAGQR